MINDEKKIDVLRTIVLGVNVILMCVTVAFQLWAFELVRHAILCSCILLLITIALVFDGILKDAKSLALHGSWFVIWLLNLNMYILWFQSFKKQSGHPCKLDGQICFLELFNGKYYDFKSWLIINFLTDSFSKLNLKLTVFCMKFLPFHHNHSYRMLCFSANSFPVNVFSRNLRK